jgi:Glycosyl transferase family 2
MPAQTHVLMTVFNAVNYVTRALESVFAQDWPGTRAIVYDDGSTDGTLRALRRLSVRHPEKMILVAEPYNEGASVARGRLVAESQRIDPAAPILWLDADDRFTRADSVASVMQQMQETKADICLYNFTVAFESDDPQLKANATGLFRAKDSHEYLLSKVRAAPGQVVVPAVTPDILEAETMGCVKAYAGHLKPAWPATAPRKLFEDFAPMALLLQANAVTAAAPERPVFEYLRRAGSLTGNRQPRHFYEDVLDQLACFKAHPAAQADPRADAFVRKKYTQYKNTLADQIAAKRPGFEPKTAERYAARARAMGLVRR